MRLPLTLVLATALAVLASPTPGTENHPLANASDATLSKGAAQVPIEPPLSIQVEVHNSPQTDWQQQDALFEPTPTIMTNAERLRLGLPLNKPHWRPSGLRSRDAAISGVPTIRHQGVIGVSEGRYISKSFTNGDQSGGFQVTSSMSDALAVGAYIPLSGSRLFTIFLTDDLHEAGSTLMQGGYDDKFTQSGSDWLNDYFLPMGDRQSWVEDKDKQKDIWSVDTVTGTLSAYWVTGIDDPPRIPLKFWLLCDNGQEGTQLVAAQSISSIKQKSGEPGYGPQFGECNNPEITLTFISSP